MVGLSRFDDGVRGGDSGGGIGGDSNDVSQCRFEKLLAECLSEACGLNWIWSFPPMLGDGQNVDLYKLFLVVRRKGGYDAVFDGKLWDLVGEESGLGVSVGPSVKLVYSKYLSVLDSWMKKVDESKVDAECGEVDDRDKFRRRLMELQADVEALLSVCAEDRVVIGEEVKGGLDDDDEKLDGRKLCGANSGVKGFGLDGNGNENGNGNGNGGCSDLEMPDRDRNESVIENVGEGNEPNGNEGDGNRGCPDSKVPDGKVNVSVGNSVGGNDAIEVEEKFDGGKMFAEEAVDVFDAKNSSVAGLLSGGEKGDDNDVKGLVFDPSAGGGGDGDSSGKRKRESVLDSSSGDSDSGSSGRKRKRESVLDSSSGDSDSGSSGRKRIRESTLGMLSWVTGVAKNPCDPEVGLIPEKPKWKSYSNQEVWKQVLLFREAVFHKRGVEPSSELRSLQSSINKEEFGLKPDCFCTIAMDGKVNVSVGNSGGGNDAMEVEEKFDGGKMSAEEAVDVFDAKNSSVAGLLCGGEKGDDNDVKGLVFDPSAGGGGDGDSSGRKRKRESVLDSSSGDSDSGSSGRKRIRESMLGMLSWVTGVAKNPCDPEVGLIPEMPKWKSYSNQEVWKQVLLFREAVFHKRGVEPSSELRSLQSQKMHPCLYDDHTRTNYNLRDRLKCDKKLLFDHSSLSAQSSTDLSGGTENRTLSPHTEDSFEKRTPDSSEAHSSLDRHPTVCVPLGSDHQAEIPEWTGVTSESDSKWLGNQIWPPATVNNILLIERDPIGKGRQDSCGCTVPSSVECVRFHISEKRAKVALELGAVFYDWNFNMVGEDFRLLWKEEEEKKFEDVVRSNPSSPETYFWDNIFRAFPAKSRADLVNYYYNVFILRRRAYQNRHTPDNIDSDDDDECGPLRSVFGHQTQNSGQQTQNVRSSILLTPKKPQTKRK